MAVAMNKKVLATTLFAVLGTATMVSAYAIDFKISGQINRAVLWADNGNKSDVFHVDNDNSSTRIRIKGSEQFDNYTAGFYFEQQFESNTSVGVDIPNTSDGADGDSERWREAWFSGSWGKLSIGQGDGAANGTSEVDLSGTTVVMYSGVVDMNGGISWVDSAGTPLGVKIKDTINQFDGLSRNDRLRYDTPKLGPFSLAFSHTNGDAQEIAIRYSSNLGGGKIAAALGIVDTTDRAVTGFTEFDQWGGSVSWLSAEGWNVTVAAGNREEDASGGVDSDNMYLKLGKRTGPHSVIIEFSGTDDLAAKGDESESVGAGYVYKANKSVELYVGGRVYSLDRKVGLDGDDITAIMAGTRVKFF